MSNTNREQPVGAIPGPHAGGALAAVAGPLSEPEKQIRADYEWCLHDVEVRRRHGGQVVAAHRGRIWGAGPDHAAALDAAFREPGCPARAALALVVVPEPQPDLGSPSTGEQ